MKATVVMLWCLMALPSLSQSTSEYTVGTITAVIPHQSATDPDIPATSYDVSLQVGDTVYVVLYTPAGGLATVRYATGRNLTVLVGKETIIYNDLLGNSSEVPILSRTSVETVSKEASGPPVQQPQTKGSVLVGIPGVKENTAITLTVEGDRLRFAHHGGTIEIAAAAIEDVVTGNDSQRVFRGAIGTISTLGPYGPGQVLTLIRFKVDSLTIEYRDADGALHGVVFTLPLHTADTVKKELIAQGAHTSVPTPVAARIEASNSTAERKP